MTPEQRLDRLERIAKLFVKAGLVARRRSREQNEKLAQLIALQKKNDERFNKLPETQKQSVEPRFRPARSKMRNDPKLDAIFREILRVS